MSKLEIKTNNHWRQFKYGYEVPEKVLKDQFDYLEEGENTDGFIQYRGCWYHTSDFMRLENKHPFPGSWNGYHSDSFFSGVLIELSDCGEVYKIGTYFS